MKKKETIKKTYRMEVFCSNCDFGTRFMEKEHMNIPVGKRVKGLECPKCKLKTIEGIR